MESRFHRVATGNSMNAATRPLLLRAASFRSKAYCLTELPHDAMSKVQELSATVSSKGQVAIPADVRRRLGLVRGSVVRFVLDAEGVRLLPIIGDVRRLKGRLARPEAPVTVEDMNHAIAVRRARIGAGPKR